MIIIIFFLYSIISFFSLFIIKDEKIKKILYLFIGIFLFFLAGLRPVGIDNDSLSYVYMFEKSDNLLTEVTFVWISALIRASVNNVQALFIVYAFIGVFLKFVAITKLSNLWFLSVIIYLSNFFILHEMTQIRVGVASCFFLLAIKPLAERRLLQYFLLIGLAVLFHYSALALIPLCFINNSPLTRRSKFLFFLLIPIAYFIYFIGVDLMVVIPIPSLNEKIEFYQALAEKGIDDEINVFNLLFLLKIVIFSFLLFKSELITTHNIYFPILIKIYSLSIFCFIAFSLIPVISFRISDIYGIIEIILFPMLYYVFKPKYLSIFIVVFVAFVFLSINLFYIELLKDLN